MLSHLSRGYSAKQRKKLHGRGSSSCELCGQLSVDEFLDGGDLDVVPGAERENEDRFVVECDATGNIAVQPRLYDAEVLVMHMYVCTY
jgi:hypothetical protein